MAQNVFQVIVVGWRDTRGRFAAQADENIARQRKVVNEQLTQVRQRASELSPRQPDEQRSKPGTKYADATPFAESWDTQIRQTGDGSEGELVNRAPHANLVLYPTRAHTIVPKNRLFLKLDPWSGDDPYFKLVHHPGTKGRADILDALDREFSKSTQQALQQVGREAAVGIEGAFSRFAGRL